MLAGGAGGIQNRQRGSETQNKARRDKFLSWRCNSVSRLEKSLYRAKKWVYGHVMVFGKSVGWNFLVYIINQMPVFAF